eukprot:gene5301-5950_t
MRLAEALWHAASMRGTDAEGLWRAASVRWMPRAYGASLP